MELIRDTVTMRREFVYGLPVELRTRTAHPDYLPIMPDTVTITLDRSREREPWEVTLVKLRGRRVLANGNVGVQDAYHLYTGKSIRSDPCAPAWLQDLTLNTLRTAEQSRTPGEEERTARRRRHAENRMRKGT